MSRTVATLGVDPGTRGGMALITANGVVGHLWAFQPGMLENDVVSAVKEAGDALKALNSKLCFMEKVGHITGDGAQGSHTFGYVKGLLRGCLLTNGLYVLNVYPMTWQSSMGCLTGGNKNVSKARAKELFPDIRITHAIADALLIAEYGRRRSALGVDAGS